MTRGLAIALALLAVMPGPTSAVAQSRPSSGTVEARVSALAAKLRCPVCQNLSVQDSPSKVATVFRGRIRELVLAGRSDEQILDFFVARYGDWILLAPPKRGIALTVWLAPALVLGAGLAIAVGSVRRWTARGRRLEAAGHEHPAALAEARATLSALERETASR